MKLTIKDGEAKELMDLLADVQPGTTLADMRDRVQRAVEGAGPRRHLTADELNVTVVAVTRLEADFARLGNPSQEEQNSRALLLAARPKLELMHDIQRSREADGSQG